MPATITRLLSDAAQTSTIEFVTSGAALGESGTLFDIGTLSGADGSGDERVRIISITAIISSANVNGGGVQLLWGGSGDLFCTFGVGTSTVKMPFEPTSGFTGDLLYAADPDVSATLRIILEKLHGFPSSLARFNVLP